MRNTSSARVAFSSSTQRCGPKVSYSKEPMAPSAINTESRSLCWNSSIRMVWYTLPDFPPERIFQYTGSPLELEFVAWNVCAGRGFTVCGKSQVAQTHSGLCGLLQLHKPMHRQRSNNPQGQRSASAT